MGWRHLIVMLSLWVFAIGYLAPGAAPAHAHPGESAMAGDCSGLRLGAVHPPGTPASHHLAMACCVAHCLPAAPIVWPILPDAPARTARIAPSYETSADGQIHSVPLPPPRSSGRI